MVSIHSEQISGSADSIQSHTFMHVIVHAYTDQREKLISKFFHMLKLKTDAVTDKVRFTDLKIN